jgi:dihydroorotate dehydrogenase (fumarate)
MPDLTTTYLGMNLKNPLVASASPLSKKLDRVKKLEDAGISAVVMYSLFEEQIVHESKALDFFLSHGSESFAEALSYFPKMESYNLGPEEYLTLIAKIKKSSQHPGNWQPEWRLYRWVGRIRQKNRRSRRRCAGA